MEEEMVYHTPALLFPCMDGLDIKPDGVYVDVTFGGGGHSKEILRRLGPDGRLFGFDRMWMLCKTSLTMAVSPSSEAISAI